MKSQGNLNAQKESARNKTVYCCLCQTDESQKIEIQNNNNGNKSYLYPEYKYQFYGSTEQLIGNERSNRWTLKYILSLYIHFSEVMRKIWRLSFLYLMNPYRYMQYASNYSSESLCLYRNFSYVLSLWHCKADLKNVIYFLMSVHRYNQWPSITRISRISSLLKLCS